MYMTVYALVALFLCRFLARAFVWDKAHRVWLVRSSLMHAIQSHLRQQSAAMVGGGSTPGPCVRQLLLLPAPAAFWPLSQYYYRDPLCHWTENLVVTVLVAVILLAHLAHEWLLSRHAFQVRLPSTISLLSKAQATCSCVCVFPRVQRVDGQGWHVWAALGLLLLGKVCFHSNRLCLVLVPGLLGTDSALAGVWVHKDLPGARYPSVGLRSQLAAAR
jgi:hypothetical protein